MMVELCNEEFHQLSFKQGDQIKEYELGETCSTNGKKLLGRPWKNEWAKDTMNRKHIGYEGMDWIKLRKTLVSIYFLT